MTSAALSAPAGCYAKRPWNVQNASPEYTWDVAIRTNIEIDDELIRAAMRVSGLKTKRSAVEEGLR